mmetsp:Transcript_34905/g.104442  ORF Transcript_34905/g.104442 Transcript_34905/m.104442 type:complete len:224 (+) Transcript_34905:122-793(+)
MGDCNSTCGNCCTCDLEPADAALPRDGARQRVQLAVSPVAIRVFQLQAYHSSVAVNDVEFSFTKQGLVGAPLFHSHFMARGPLQIIDMGHTDVPASKMLTALEPFFKSGSYDILRKNCNAFSDCALYCLLGARLDEEYRAVDRLGTSADRFGLVRLITMFDYRPNPRADGFSVDRVLQHLGSQCHHGQSVTAGWHASRATHAARRYRSVWSSRTESMPPLSHA